MSDDPEQTIIASTEMRDKALQLLFLVICRLVDTGKSSTTDRLHFERDKLIHEVDRSERSSFAFAFPMDSQEEDEKRGKDMSDTNDMTEQLPTVPDTVDKFMGQEPFDLMHYELAAFGGAVSCSVTHRGTTSVDIVNSQMQLKPAKYTSFISVDKNTISAEGSGALSTYDMTTFQCFQCYFVQRWFKCGGVEICKTREWVNRTQRNRDSSTLGGPAVAEIVADAFLCPYEAYRIRYISDPCYANGVLATGQKFVAENDATIGLFFNFGQMMYKQNTHTRTKFCFQQKVAKAIRQNLGTSPSEMSKDVVLTSVPCVWHRDWCGGPCRVSRLRI